MDNKAFKYIIDKLNTGECTELLFSANGKEYIRRFVKKDRLIILGGGHVSLDLYRMALMLDFDIFVVDDRPMFANNDRFPEAQVICDDLVSAINSLGITDKDYVCVITRGHRWDRECVETVLSGFMPYYLGMISSRRRAEGLKELLTENGFEKDRVEAIHAPIGLKIGAMTTAEIALSICAEMIAERRRERYIAKDNELVQTAVCYEMLNFLSAPNEPCAVLIVLSSTGSTPVKSGSMMALTQSGTAFGTIGGGCSEAAAMNKARRLIGSGKSAVISFDMSDEVAADSGMVCGGEMTVYIEDIAY